MSDHFEPNDPFRTSGILNSPEADKVSMVTKGRSHKDKHLIFVARTYMRPLACLLIEVRNIKNDKSLSLLPILHPSEFKSFVATTLQIIKPLALKTGTLLKKAIGGAYYLEIQKNRINYLKCFKFNEELIEEERATEVSLKAGLDINRFIKTTTLPKTEDISKIKYLDVLIAKEKTELNSNSTNEATYEQLIEGTYR